ncbi:KGP1 kinase, partial [Pseudoatta argentina]
MDSIRDLKRLLYERTEALRRRDEIVEILEKALEERDATIRYLQNEIDKFRQIVELNLASTAIDSNQRLKRQAISAEPLRSDTKPVMKFTKPQRSRELIKTAILDNDFMKNLELTQIREIVDCMYPVTFPAGSIIIQEGDVGSTVFVMEDLSHGKSFHHLFLSCIITIDNMESTGKATSLSKKIVLLLTGVITCSALRCLQIFLYLQHLCKYFKNMIS